MPTSTSENLPCTDAGDSTRSSENDITTTDRDSMEISIDAGALVDVRKPSELEDSTTSGRRTFSREKKLLILKFYYANGCNKYKTCKQFGIHKGSLMQWIQNEEEIQKGKKGSKRIIGGGRKPFWPDVEEKLVEEFKELRQKGLKVKHY